MPKKNQKKPAPFVMPPPLPIPPDPLKGREGPPDLKQLTDKLIYELEGVIDYNHAEVDRSLDLLYETRKRLNKR